MIGFLSGPSFKLCEKKYLWLSFKGICITVCSQIYVAWLKSPFFNEHADENSANRIILKEVSNDRKKMIIYVFYLLPFYVYYNMHLIVFRDHKGAVSLGAYKLLIVDSVYLHVPSSIPFKLTTHCGLS